MALVDISSFRSTRNPSSEALAQQSESMGRMVPLPSYPTQNRYCIQNPLSSRVGLDCGEVKGFVVDLGAMTV
jgi:hypothetical protein